VNLDDPILKWLSLKSPPLRKFGVTPGGPCDRESALFASAFVGGKEDEPHILEIGPFGRSLTISAGVMVGLCGAERKVILDGKEISPNGAWWSEKEQQLIIQPTNKGVYSYLAIGKQRRQPRTLATFSVSLQNPGVLRVLPGPEAEVGFEKLLQAEFEVSNEFSPVGIRLQNLSELTLAHSHPEIPSEPQVPGGIQLPASGNPIILGPNGPTTGGYPKIAVLIDADLDSAFQLPPGRKVRFQHVSYEEARELSENRRKRLENTLTILKLVP
jgi:allophanate hydrolase subunit 2